MGYFGKQNHNLHSSLLDSNIMGRLLLFTGSSYTGKKLLGEGGGEAHFPALKSDFLQKFELWPDTVPRRFGLFLACSLRMVSLILNTYSKV